MRVASERLTKKQIFIVSEGLANGKYPQQIADEQGRSINTINNQIADIYDRLPEINRCLHALVAWWYKEGCKTVITCLFLFIMIQSDFLENTNDPYRCRREQREYRIRTRIKEYDYGT